MSAEFHGYRGLAPQARELYDWDIVLLHGTVRAMGITLAHLDGCSFQQFGAKCTCLEQPRISSPIVCPDTRRVLRESWYSHEPTTGEARHLLALEPGDTVAVESGKTYRLVGPRKVEGHDAFASGSIFRVYPDEDWPKEVPATSFWGWLYRAIYGPVWR